MSKIVLNGESFDLRGPAGPDGNPIGTIISFMGLKAPKDYLICDGSVYKISDYPNLVSFFKEQFGSETYFGDAGSGTFAVPDMRNLFLRGYHGTAARYSGEIGIKQEGTIHPAFSQGFGSNGNPFASFSAGKENARPKNVDSSETGNGTQWLRSSEFNTTSTIFTYTSRPVNMAVLYCIKAVDSQTVYETFEEYDTTIDGCQWHVRKWSNGYCELFGKKKFTNMDFTAQWSGSFYANNDSKTHLPFPLLELYSAAAYTYDYITTVMATVSDPEHDLSKTPNVIFYRFSSATGLDFSVGYTISGRWKEVSGH